MSSKTRGRAVWPWVWAAVLTLPAGCREGAEPPQPPDADAAESLLDDLPPEDPRPTFEFSESLRSKNESLNRFIEEFRGICERGEYERYRQAVTIQLDPVDRSSFENIWHAVEHVRVELIKRLPELEEIPSPAYAVLLRAALREEYINDRPERQVVIVAFQEEGEWVFAPSPDDRINRAMRTAAAQLLADEPDDLFPSSQPATD